MNNAFNRLALAVAPLVLSAGTVLAVQPGQLMRSDELNETQQQVLDQARTSRRHMIRDYSVSGITLSSEQSAAVAKLIEPVRGNFLTYDEVQVLCRSVRDYLHKETKSASVSCFIKQDVFRIEVNE